MAILSHSSSDTATSLALKAKLLKKAKFEPTEQNAEEIPFSSDCKYFGGRPVSYAGTYDIVVSPAKYRLYQLTRWVNRRLRKLG